ncbi:hypothetical protein D3C72_2069280 [compost metagenome]
MHPILIAANQLPHILAAGAESTLTDLLVYESLQAVGKGDVHRAHNVSVGALAKFGNHSGLSEVI